MDEITSPRPEDLNKIERVSIDGTDYVSVSGLMEFLKLGRTSFYARLKELDIAPVRVGRQTYLNLDSDAADARAAHLSAS